MEINVNSNGFKGSLYVYNCNVQKAGTETMGGLSLKNESVN